MFSESAELYDAIYGTFKDYVAEADTIASMVRAAHPRAGVSPVRCHLCPGRGAGLAGAGGAAGA